jgi:hypothetical protein
MYNVVFSSNLPATKNVVTWTSYPNRETFEKEYAPGMEGSYSILVIIAIRMDKN